MARRAFWPTVETSEATIFARGNLTLAECAPAPTDCCDAVAPSGTVCCPDGFDQTALFSALGPLGAAFGIELLEYELNFDNARRSWIGGAEGPDGAAIALEIWCEEDDELGTIWWMAGSYFAAALGVRMPFMLGGLTPVNGLIVGEIEVPGSTTALTVAVTHPCSELEPEGGSGSPSSSGGTDPGGSLTLCGCAKVGTTVYAAFSGALAYLGVQAFTYSGPLLGWTVNPPDGPCNAATSPIGFNCQSGTTWILSSPGSGVPVSTSFSATATAISCSPLVVNFHGTATGTCGGPWSAVVSEYDPSSIPPAGPPAPGQPNYCVNAYPGGLLLTPKTDSSWWSDHAGSWTLSRVSETGWRLVNPVGDVFFSGSWDGTGSHSFEGIYTVKVGGCP